jgi:ATP-dependent DNA ligase
MLEPPIEPMLAKLTPAIPPGPGWLYEPKWDGFRTLVFVTPTSVYLQSRDARPLGRYFPELEEALPRIIGRAAVLDGEIVIMGRNGLEFDTLQLRLHPAASRVKKLAAETPAVFVAFDILAEGDEDLRAMPFGERRQRLESLVKNAQPPLYLTPATEDAAVAEDWFHRFEGAGFDGIIAKPLEGPYQPGVRAMAKIKHLRTADCVVGGFRWNRGEEGRSVGSLLLGLYDAEGVFHHVGHTSSFSAQEKRDLVTFLEPYRVQDESTGFGAGRTPGAPSRWSSGKELAWERLRPELVCEVSFDYLQGPRIRHAATFKRWRTDKPPRDCTFDQFEAVPPAELLDLFGA